MSRSNDQLQRTLSKTFTPTVETFTRRQCNNLEHNVAVLLEGDEKQAAYRSTTSSRRRKAKWLLTQAVETLDSVRFVIFSTLSPKTLGEITDTEKREFVGQLKGTIEALSVSAALENKAIAWFEKYKARLLEAGLNLRDKATDDVPPSTRQPIPLVNRRERLDTEWPRHGDSRDGVDIDSHGDPASTASAHKRKRTGGPEPRGLGGECGPRSGQTSTEDEIKSLLQRLGELPITNPRKQQLVEQVKEVLKLQDNISDDDSRETQMIERMPKRKLNATESNDGELEAPRPRTDAPDGQSTNPDPRGRDTAQGASSVVSTTSGHSPLDSAEEGEIQQYPNGSYRLSPEDAKVAYSLQDDGGVWVEWPPLVGWGVAATNFWVPKDKARKLIPRATHFYPSPSRHRVQSITEAAASLTP